MEKGQAQKLLQKYRMGLCTPREAEVVERWLDELVIRNKDLLPEDELSQRNRVMWSVISEEIGHSEEEERGRIPEKGAFLVFTNYRALAAILVLALGIVLGVYSFLGREVGAKSDSTLTTSGDSGADVQPGFSGALLTLSNGETVVLDSLGADRIDSELNTVIQRKGNVLHYNSLSDNPDKKAYNTVSTPKARQYHLVLSDGTQIYLNSGSSIKYPTSFDNYSREVYITGEVFFEVSHTENKGRRVPFIVHVGNTEVEVLGTEFNVNAYSDERFVCTTLITGAVDISSEGKKRSLRPGGQARVDGSGGITIADHVNTEKAVAWKNGYFSFENEDITVVMRQLSRWYDVEVVFDGEIPTETFWGELQRDAPLSVVLRVLEKSGVRFSVEGKRVKVLKVERSPRPDG